MDAGAWFWIIYVMAILFGGGFTIIGRPLDNTPGVYRVYGSWVGMSFILFVLIGILGYRVFSSPIH